MKKCVIIILTFLYIIQGTAKDTREIIIRGDSAFPPYEFINDKGEPDGFNIDLTRAIMDELKLPYDLQLEDWSDILQQFEKGEIDLITGMAKFESPQNGPSKLSKAHSYINYKFVCRKDALIQHTKDLSHKNVIVQRYALPHKKLKDMGYDSHLIPVDNMMEGLNMLSEGKGDMAICLDNMAQYIIYKDGLTNLSIIDSEWPLQEYCFVGSDTQLLEQINSALLKLKKNGVYDRIHVKWLGEKPTFSIPTWLYFLLGALLLTALLLSIFVTIYKKRAQKGEILLKEENEKLNALLLENKNFLNRYQTVFNTTLVGLSYYDKKGILVSVNDEMARLFQMDNKNKLLKEQLSIYANPVLRNHGIIDEQNQIHEFHGILKYDMRKEQCPQYFARFTPFDQIFYFKMDVTPIKDQEGELIGILITAIDRTAEEKHERQMAEQEAKLNMAMNAGNVTAWIYELHTQEFMLRGNMRTEKGLNMEKYLGMLHPDDRIIQKELFDTILHGQKESAETVFRYMHEDGTYHYYDSRMISKKEEDTVTAILGTQKDITQEILNNKILNDTIEKLRFAIQTAGMAMWEYNCDTQLFTTYNEPVADYKDGAVISMSTYDCYSQKDDENLELIEKAADIVKDRKNESYNFIVRLNITEQINYQKFLEREKETAQQADKLKSAFLANMSHEIRTPLNAIVGFSELLQTTEDVNMRKEFMNIINNNNELLLRLIGDILDLSKIESGLMELKLESFDLADAYKETFMALKQRCTNPEVEFIGHNPYKSCLVKLDKNRLVQVGTNFITNAIKHTDRGRITMGYSYIDGGIKLYVEDTGHGIPKEKQHKLFQRFAKLDDFTQGTGLGLAICKAITDAQGGKIGMESDEGKGSKFWAWFPCEAEIEKYEETEEIAEDILRIGYNPTLSTSQESCTNDVQKKSILVAEDIDSNYMLVKALLKTSELTRAYTGKEAVELASSHHYDAILMDMKMPVMGGLEATREIRKFDTETPIIAVTANAFEFDREEAMRAGCNTFITKPLNKKELKEVLGD